ncbi:MAG: FHA domain-containing protein, partial [Chloroflexi bacterium]|nr:FHA domain-containing protein [Chloroflexota bacterium]
GQPISELVPEILKVLGWPESSGDRVLKYELLSEAGDLLDPGETLDQSGIENSDVIWIRLAEGEEHTDDESLDGTGAGGVSDPQSERAPLGTTPADAPRGAPQPPIEANIEIHQPSLVSRDGLIFELGDPPIMIGRAGRNYDPDIDLTDLDPEFASSRRHARIESEGGRLVIAAMRTTNGTFVNGLELNPGSRHPLEPGDEVQFGFEGVKMNYFPQGQRLPASYFK